MAWHDSATDQGTVIATDWSGVQIEWDNGKGLIIDPTHQECDCAVNKENAKNPGRELFLS